MEPDVYEPIHSTQHRFVKRIFVSGELPMTGDRGSHFMERRFRDTECALNVNPSTLALRMLSEPGKARGNGSHAH